MQTNEKLEKVYELLEQYEFIELSEIDKQIVLSVITESEYSEMRKTIDVVKREFETDIELVKNMPVNPMHAKERTMYRFLNYKLKLYQVAASIAIIFASFFLYQHSDKNPESQMIAVNDTITIHRVDTVKTVVYDTVEIIKEKVKYMLPKAQETQNVVANTSSKNQEDCNANLCPNQISDLIALNGKNDISKDSTIKGILLSLN